MLYYLIPVFVLGGLLLLLGLLIFLGRFRGGRLLRPVVSTLAKVPFLRKLLQKASTAALERQNPELMSVMRKLERAGAGKDPMKAQQVIHQLNPAERRAYTEYMEVTREQTGGGPETEAMNRQQRRLLERQYGQPRASTSSSGGQRKKKRR